MSQSIKLAFRVLGRRKFFTFISLFGISMTLVVLMVAAAVIDNFFAPRAPESRFDRVLAVYVVSERGPRDNETMGPGLAFIDRFIRTLPGIERASAVSPALSSAIYDRQNRIDISYKKTDADYWQIMNFAFLEGHPFTASDDAAGARVAVITDRLRTKLFGDGAAVGKALELEGRSFRIIGVVPHVSLTRFVAYSDVWIPIGASTTSEDRRKILGGFNALVLARSRADFPRLKRAFANELRHFPFDDPRIYNKAEAGLDTTFEALARALTWNKMGDRAPLVVTGVVSLMTLLFMLLPALNLITLNLSRILERSSEIGVRRAFGASRPVLIRQFIAENLVLTLIGGVIGFLLSVTVIVALNRSGLIPDAKFDVNLRIFGYGMLLATAFGLVSGVYPAWRMSRLDPVNALRGGAR